MGMGKDDDAVLGGDLRPKAYGLKQVVHFLPAQYAMVESDYKLPFVSLHGGQQHDSCTHGSMDSCGPVLCSCAPHAVVNIFGWGNVCVSQGKAASALGYAFQIRDDILGTWGDQNSTGKPVGADIRRKKNALPIVHLMNHIEQDSRQKIITLMQGDNLEDSDVQLILRHMSSVGSYEFCQNLAEQFCSTARDEIIFSGVPRVFMSDFEELIEFVARRVH